MEYLIKDMGIPPDSAWANALSKELSMQIRYESLNLNWTTSNQLPSIKEVQANSRPFLPYQDPPIMMRWYRGRFFISR